MTAFLEHHPRDVKIGIDVMRNTLRYDETVEDFIEVLSDQVEPIAPTAFPSRAFNLNVNLD